MCWSNPAKPSCSRIRTTAAQAPGVHRARRARARLSRRRPDGLVPAALPAERAPGGASRRRISSRLARCCRSVGRVELLDWATSTRAWLIEDDYDGEFRYGGRPLAALKSLDRDGRVIYIGSFSKALFPALRLGYMVLPPAVRDAFVPAKWLEDRGCNCARAGRARALHG